MLPQGHMVAPLYRYTGKVAPRFGKSMPLCHVWGWYLPQIASYIYKTYIECLSHWYAVSRAYGCTLIPLHWPSCPQIWGFRFTSGLEMMPQRHGWGWYPLQTTSYIHIRHIQSVWAIGMLSQGHMGAPLFRYTGRLAPDLGTHNHLCSENDAITSWLRLISTHLWLQLFHASVHTALYHQEVLPHHIPIWRTNLPFLVKPLAKYLKSHTMNLQL